MKDDNRRKIDKITSSSWWGLLVLLVCFGSMFVLAFGDNFGVDPIIAQRLGLLGFVATFLLSIPGMLRHIDWRPEDDLEIKTRYPDGCCRSCGYNLTGNTSGFCPECGVPVLPKDMAERARQVEAVRAHYLGDKVGLLVFGVMGVGGGFCLLYCSDELPLIGFFLAGIGGLGIIFTIVHLISLRRFGGQGKGDRQGKGDIHDFR